MTDSSGSTNENLYGDTIAFSGSAWLGDFGPAAADFTGEINLATHFCGDGGRLAGDWSSDALKGEVVGLKHGCVSASGKVTPRFGDSFSASLKGLGGGLRAGLAVRAPETVAADFGGELGAIAGVKSSFLAASEFLIDPRIPIEDLTGDLLKGLIGVFAPLNSSSELTEEFDFAT